MTDVINHVRQAGRDQALIKLGFDPLTLAVPIAGKHFFGNAISEYGQYIPGLKRVFSELAGSGYRAGQRGAANNPALQSAGALLVAPGARDAYTTAKSIGRVMPQGTTQLPGVSGHLQGIQNTIEKALQENPNATLHSVFGNSGELNKIVEQLQHSVPDQLRPHIAGLKGYVDAYSHAPSGSVPLSSFYDTVKDTLSSVKNQAHFFENMPTQADTWYRKGLDSSIRGLGYGSTPVSEVVRDIRNLFTRRTGPKAGTIAETAPRAERISELGPQWRMDQNLEAAPAARRPIWTGTKPVPRAPVTKAEEQVRPRSGYALPLLGAGIGLAGLGAAGTAGLAMAGGGASDVNTL